MKKYICYGDYIQSKNDKEWHYISPHEIARLYKVNPKECIFIDCRNEKDNEKLYGIDKSKYIGMYPKYSGNYNIGRV